MAGQHATTTTSAPASIVGNAFVIRYYTILHQSPHLVHRFYTDDSKLSRAEAWAETTVESATTLTGIHDKIMSLDYGSTRAEIMTVDSQESLTGNVLVMVTGALYNAGGVKRTFVQTFVLVPQEKSYFVFNDMFRYLDGDDKASQQPASPVVNCAPEPQDSPANTISEQGVSKPAVLPDTHALEYPSPEAQEEITVEEDHYELPEKTEVSGVLEDVLVENSSAGNVIADQAEIPESEPNELQDAVEELIDEAPKKKKSYASILRLQKDGSKAPVLATPAATTSKVVSVHIERSASSAALQAVQSATQLPSGGMSSPDHTDENSAAEIEGDGRSVYVKSLPLNVTVAELEEEFSKFGQLKPGGVNLRNQRIGVCYAFVEFEEASSAQSATEASPINMSGRQVYVEEKRIFPFRGGRGRFNQGRGYHNDGMRGRGYFNSRGMGRGGVDSDRDFGRGRGIIAGRGGYFGGNSYMPNTFRRLDSQNANGFRPMRRGAGNQMGRNGPLARNGIAVAAA